MNHLSQRNPNWANLHLLPSKLTVGRYGCTTTCISMLSDYFKCYGSPAHVIDKNIKYTVDGLVIWASINFPNFKFESRTFSFNAPMIDRAINDPNRAVILNVGNKSHWVVALRKVPFTKLYWILDPWDGKVKLSSAYSTIDGAAHFIRTKF